MRERPSPAGNGLTIRLAKTETPVTTLPIVQNAADWPNKFKARFIEPGVISYEDIKNGRAFLSKQTLERDIQSFVGKPLVIRHNSKSVENGEPVGDPKPENLRQTARGYISNVYCDPTDGFYYAEGVCFDDEAKKLIRSGWKVSCCYAPKGPRGPGGKRNGVAYDYETRGFSGEHLAIEPADKVRYEAANIVLNAKTNSTTMFKLFAKKPAAAGPTAADEAAAAQKKIDDAAAEAAKIENAKTAAEAMEITAETPIEIDGAQVPLSDVVAGYKASLVENAISDIDPETEIEYAEGKKAKMGVMCAHYRNAMEKEEKEKEEIENSKKKAKNSTPGHFIRLTSAAATAASRQTEIGSKVSTNSREARIARGNARWGKPVAASGNL